MDCIRKEILKFHHAVKEENRGDQLLQHKALFPVIQQTPSPQLSLVLSVSPLAHPPAQKGAVPDQKHPAGAAMRPVAGPAHIKKEEVKQIFRNYKNLLKILKMVTNVSTRRQDQHPQENGNKELCHWIYFQLQC